jgi:hypothetical protein
MNDPLWAELEELAQRAKPRYDPQRFGRCLACGLGPTVAYPLSTETWAGCEPCNTLWHVGKGVLAPEQSEAMLSLYFQTLAGLQELQPNGGQPPSPFNEEIRMAKPQLPTQRPDVVNYIDEKEYSELRRIDPPVRRVMTGGCFDEILQHESRDAVVLKGDIMRLSYAVLDRIRAERCGPLGAC